MDDLIDEYWRQMPRDFPHLLQMRLIWSGDDDRHNDLELTLADLNGPRPNKILVLMCNYISLLRMAQPGLFAIGPLQIKSIAERQLENMRYEIRDCEGEFLQFTCRDFTVQITGWNDRCRLGCNDFA